MTETTRLIRFDWAIKNILRNKANFDVLEGFLTALLKKDITILDILESESNQDDKNAKFNRVDLLVEDADGTKIIIEVQTNREVHYLERLSFGTSKLIVDNLQLGTTYKDVKKVISVSILYFIYGENADDYVYYGTTEFRGLHSHSVLRLTRKDKDVLHTVEAKDIFPEYFLIEIEKFQDVVNNDLDEWVYLLKNESIKDDFKAKNIDKAKEKLDFLKLPIEQRRQYEKYLDQLASERDILVNAREEGRAEGREEGKIEIVRAMHANGIDIEQIAHLTGLPHEKLHQILK